MASTSSNAFITQGIKSKGWFALEPKSGAARRPLLHQPMVACQPTESLEQTTGQWVSAETYSLYLYCNVRGQSLDIFDRLLTPSHFKPMEIETKRVLAALLRLSIAAASENSYSELYENSTVEDDYLFIVELILNNNSHV